MRRLEANGTSIACARTGTGSPVVLVHGDEADHSMLRRSPPGLKGRMQECRADRAKSADEAARIFYPQPLIALSIVEEVQSAGVNPGGRRACQCAPGPRTGSSA